MKYNVTVDRDEDGAWIVECPSIPGCVSQGQQFLGFRRLGHLLWLRRTMVSFSVWWRSLLAFCLCKMWSIARHRGFL
jgi:hypothetical protein